EDARSPRLAGGAEPAPVRRLPPRGDLPRMPFVVDGDHHRRADEPRLPRQPAPARLRRLARMQRARRPQRPRLPEVPRPERRAPRLPLSCGAYPTFPHLNATSNRFSFGVAAGSRVVNVNLIWTYPLSRS